MLIFHVDVNSAYLSWTAAELLKNGYGRDIRQMESAISGNPGSRHGIILAKSVSAKARGVRTGETTAQAKRKCPGLLLYPPDYKVFSRSSDAMFSLLSGYTSDIERFSIDECFMDVSDIPAFRADPVGSANDIRRRIGKELGFTVNIGIGENKVCAKMAGELKKPDMVHTLWKEELPGKLWPLPVEKLFMVGASSRRKLNEAGIMTIGDLANADAVMIRSILKSHGDMIYRYANGEDDSKVIKDSEQKGIGNSMTFPYDLRTEKELFFHLLSLSEQVGTRLRKTGKKASQVSVEIKYSDFRKVSHQVKLHNDISSTTQIYETAKKLLRAKWNGKAVRLLGVSVSGLSGGDEVQLSMFDDSEQEKLDELGKTVDMIRARYGSGSLVRGCFIDRSRK